MKRTQSLAAAVSVACIAAGVAGNSSASALRQLDVLPLDTGQIEAKLRALGLTPVQIVEVTGFLALDRAGQSAALKARGIDDPGGSLTDSFVSDYILGQYLQQVGGPKGRAIALQLRSGKPNRSPEEAKRSIALGQTLGRGDIEITEVEIEQQMKATGLPRETAELRARLQRAATLLRPYLAKLVPGLASVWVDEGPKLVISAAGPADAVGKALGRQSWAGFPVEVRTVRYSKTTLSNMATGLQQALAREAPGAKLTVSANPTTSVVRLIPADDTAAAALRASKTVAESVRKGDAVVEKARKQGPSAVIGGVGTMAGGCTWGFASVSGSDKVLATAGHCVGEGGYPYVGTTFDRERWGGAVDAAVHKTDPYFYGWFDNYVARSGLPDLEITSRTGWSQQDYNDVVCHQGTTSGHSCGYITGLFSKPYWVPGSDFFVLVEGPTLNDQAGDSGGPWFSGNSAYGIHSGGEHTYGTWDHWGLAVYGAIDFAEQDLNFTVMTK